MLAWYPYLTFILAIAEIIPALIFLALYRGALWGRFPMFARVVMIVALLRGTNRILGFALGGISRFVIVDPSTRPLLNWLLGSDFLAAALLIGVVWTLLLLFLRPGPDPDEPDSLIGTVIRQALQAVMPLAAVVGIDARGAVTQWSPLAERIFGWTASEAVGRELASFLVPERHRERHRAGLRAAVRTGEGPLIGKTIKVPALTRAGGEASCLVSISSFRSQGAYEFVAFLLPLGVAGISADMELE